MRMIHFKKSDVPEINRKEILRYAGMPSGDSDVDGLVSECLREVENKLSFKLCYSCFPISISGDSVDLGFTKVYSKDLAKNLKFSSHIVLFAATLGIEIDRLIAKYSITSPARALILQAIGTERIESLCDSFNGYIKRKYCCTAPRFSAGYGDFPLEAQRDIFEALDCSKNIGVTLNDSLLMTPSKSVTAIIGIFSEDGRCL